MLKKYIEERFRVVNYLQVGKEVEGNFSGLVIFNNMVFYVRDNDLLIFNKENTIESYLKENEEYAEIVKEVSAAIDSYSIVLDKNIKRFVITNPEKMKENFVKQDTEVLLKEKFIKNQFRKEENWEFPAEQYNTRTLLIYNDFLNTLEIMKANNKEKYTELIGALGIKDEKK